MYTSKRYVAKSKLVQFIVDCRYKAIMDLPSGKVTISHIEPFHTVYAYPGSTDEVVKHLARADVLACHHSATEIVCTVRKNPV